MIIMSNKKFNNMMVEKENEHENYIRDLCDKYERTLDHIGERNLDLRVKNNHLKRELNSIDNDKIRYLRMIENKQFKSKRLKKKHQYKLIREIKLLFGGD